MKKRIIITSLFSANTINPIIAKLSPTDLILVVEKDLKNLSNKDVETKKEAIEYIKQNFGKIINIEILETKSLYDLYEITKDIVTKIDNIKEGEIMFNISEGRKTLSFGMSFAAYLRHEKIKAIYYLIKETNELLQMPFLKFSINKVQKEILESLMKKSLDLKSLKENMGKSKSVFYNYIKELQINGYIIIEDENIYITNLGKIVIL